ncbi:MAG: hypothetical protein PQJ46_01490 [Spirochaetales bacterium]|nr:hypothetical protein [Spirochaetales bacterium]
MILSLLNSGSANNVLTSSENIVFMIYRGQGRGLWNGGRKYSKYGKGKLVLYKEQLKFIPYTSKAPLAFDTRELE